MAGLLASSSGVGRNASTIHGSTSGDKKDQFDDLEDSEFDPVAKINKILPNEQSLAEVDLCLGQLKDHVRDIDKQILAAVRDQATSYNQAQRDLVHVNAAIKELFECISNMRSKSEASEVVIGRIARDVKTLDNAKKNLTAAIIALKRLVMLVTALDQLRAFAAERRYEEAANLVWAASELELHFASMTSVPRIQEVLRQKKEIYNELQRQILEDFDAIFDTDQEVISNLHDACLTVDAMDMTIRRDIITTFCLKLLESYKKIFNPPSDESSLEHVERRYAWYKRNARALSQKYGSTFPARWRVPRHFAEHFCHITRQHLVEVLGASHHVAKPTLLVSVLQKSKEFEASLSLMYSEDSQVESALVEADERNAALISQRLPSSGDWRYPETVSAAATGRPGQHASQSSTGQQSAGFTDLSSTTKKVEEASQGSKNDAEQAPRFKGTISDCFEAYLGTWVRYEESQLTEAVRVATSVSTEAIVQQQIGQHGKPAGSGVDDDDDEEELPRLVYSSASKVFSEIKVVLQRGISVSTHQALLELSQVFRKVLREYSQGYLSSKIPKKGTALTEEQVKTVCCVVGTAEYCEGTLNDLAAAIIKSIDEVLAPKITFDAERELFWELKSAGIAAFVGSLSIQLEVPFAAMAASDWVGIDDVGEVSPYLSDLIDILHSQLPLLSSQLSAAYFRFFCDKFAQALIPKFIASIYACRSISETGAQQLLLDAYTLKTTFCEIPSTYGRGDATVASTPYVKFVLREMGKAEILLKVLSSSDENSESFAALLQEEGFNGETVDLARILALKASPATSTQGFQSRLAAGPILRPPPAAASSLPQHQHHQTSGAAGDTSSASSSTSAGITQSSSALAGEQQGGGLQFSKLDLQAFTQIGDSVRQKAAEDVKRLFSRL